MQDGGYSQARFAQLYARAEAARSQARAYRCEFVAMRQKFTELRREFMLARKRSELVRELWLSPGGDGQIQYTPHARMVARLASMPVIEQAKGIIMAQCGWSAEQAFDALRQASQRTNTKVRVLAAQIVTATVRSEQQPSSTVPGPRRSADAVLTIPDLGSSRPRSAQSVAIGQRAE